MAVWRFRPQGGVLDHKWNHRSIPWHRFGIGRLWNFSAIFYLSKVIRLFRSACKMPFEIFGEGIFPVKKIFIDEIPTGPSLGQSASFDASCVQIGSVVWSVGPVTLFTACSIAHASQLKLHLKVTFRSASTQLSAQNLPSSHQVWCSQTNSASIHRLD
jgi:hypothetical protein